MSSPTQAQRNVQLEDIYPNGFDVSYKIFIFNDNALAGDQFKIILRQLQNPGKIFILNTFS